MFRAFFHRFRRSEQGQDLSEFCLITAFVALVALAIFVYVSGGMQSIWGTAGQTLARTPATQTNSGGAAPATASTPAR